MAANIEHKHYQHGDQYRIKLGQVKYLMRMSGLSVATVSKNFKINLEGQNYVHFYVILSRNVKIFGIMASL